MSEEIQKINFIQRLSFEKFFDNRGSLFEAKFLGQIRRLKTLLRHK